MAPTLNILKRCSQSRTTHIHRIRVILKFVLPSSLVVDSSFVDSSHGAPTRVRLPLACLESPSSIWPTIVEYKSVSSYPTIPNFPNMTRKPKGVKIISFTEPVQPAVPNPVDERHRHACYVTQGSHLRASRTFVTTQPLSDAHDPAPEPEPLASEGNLPSDFDPSVSQFPYPWMDPTYIDDSDQVDEVEPGARKRTRMLAVVSLVSLCPAYHCLHCVIDKSIVTVVNSRSGYIFVGVPTARGAWRFFRKI